MSYHIFVSHIHDERDLALNLKTEVEKCFLHAVTVFVSSHKEDIRLGDDWLREIEMQLEKADMVIILLTPRSVSRPWINFETGAAWFRKSRLVPVCAGGLRVDDLPPPFNRKNALELKNAESAAMLIREIAHEANLDEPKCDLSSLMVANAALVGEQSVNIAAVTEPNHEEIKKERLPQHLGSEHLFAGRLGEAFPGLRGIEEIKDEHAVDRLVFLLREPLCREPEDPLSEHGDCPFWWLRGMTNMYIDRFERLGSNRVLMELQELTISRIVAVRTFDRPEKDFVYVEVSSDEPSGVYKYQDDWLQKRLEENLKNGRGYYVSETYGLWNGMYISAEEGEDGATVIDGKPVKTVGAEPRIRYLTAYNFCLGGNHHVLNHHKFDQDTTKLMDKILLKQATVNDLVEYVSTLNMPSRFDL